MRGNSLTEFCGVFEDLFFGRESGKKQYSLPYVIPEGNERFFKNFLMGRTPIDFLTYILQEGGERFLWHL